MKVLLFSDIHGDLPALELLVTEEADLYISAGASSLASGFGCCRETTRRTSRLARGARIWLR